MNRRMNMTEELSFVNFVLGIIGTITGIGALIIHLLRLRKENPRIKVKVLSCEHDFEPKRNQLSFWTKFQIRNLGDRGTSLNDIDLVFISDNKRHLLKKQYFRGPVEASERKWINPRETMDLEVDFWEEYQGLHFFDIPYTRKGNYNSCLTKEKSNHCRNLAEFHKFYTQF